MKKALAILALLGLICVAQTPPWGGFAPTNKARTPASGFNPTNTPNTLWFLNYRDLAPGPVTTITDEVSGIIFSNWSPTYFQPTNTGMGLYFYTGGLTNNSALTNGHNFSIWVVAASTQVPAAPGQMLGDRTTTENGIYISSSNTLASWWGGTLNRTTYKVGTTVAAAASGWVTNPPLWNDIVDSQGSYYNGGIVQAAGFSRPAANYIFTALGNDSGRLLERLYQICASQHQPCDYGDRSDQPLYLGDDKRSHQCQRWVCRMVQVQRFIERNNTGIERQQFNRNSAWQPNANMGNRIESHRVPKFDF